MKLLGYLVYSLGNCVIKLCIETGLSMDYGEAVYEQNYACIIRSSNIKLLLFCRTE